MIRPDGNLATDGMQGADANALSQFQKDLVAGPLSGALPTEGGRGCGNAPQLTAGRCQCPACGLLLSSVREFDRHRTGGFARQGEWHGSRRCLTAEELIARGWRTNAKGYWMQSRSRRAPAGLQASYSLPPLPAEGTS